MDALKAIQESFNVDLNQSVIQLPASRWHQLGPLLDKIGCVDGVELGVYRGRFTASLAKQTKMNIVGIDAWTVYGDYVDYSKNDLENEAYLDAVRRTKDYDNVTLMKGWSTEAAKNFPDNSLDYIFIDANHAFEFVVEDLKAWEPKIKEGGIIMGHDYFVHKKLNFGVIDAVNGWLKSRKIKHLFLWRDNCPSWMYIKGDK